MTRCHMSIASFLLCFFLNFAMSVTPLWAVTKASIVVCSKTGKVLSASNPDAITHPASLTKMMTLYMVFKALDRGHLRLDQKIPVSKHASIQDPCKLWLKPGSAITVRHAIMGMVTKSANDAAAAMGEYFGKGCEKRFAKMMTQQARKLGMKKTVFQNASGLPHRHQVTTARDMAILSHALYQHFPHHVHVFKAKSFTYKGVTHNNHNHLLGKVKGVDGIKTGFINASGSNLAASVVRNNQRIIAVVMGGESWHARDKHMTKLIEKTFVQLAKHSSPSEERYASIGDLIASHSQGIQKAAYVSSSTGKVKSMEPPHSLDDLFKVIDEKPLKYGVSKKKSTKKRTKKAKKKGKKKST